MFYPYVGVLQFRISVNNSIKCQFLRETIKVDIILKTEDNNKNLAPLKLNLQLELIPTPNRFFRILFDTFHNLYYPWDGYIPKDNIASNEYSYNYDWTMETLDTNYFNVSNLLL